MNKQLPPSDTMLQLERIMKLLAECRASRPAYNQPGPDIYDARGDYETALTYLKQSLAIQQEIGDWAGLCTTLFNMGHIHWQNGEQQEALRAWVTVYRLAQSMHLAQVIDALKSLAGQLGLPGGMDGWEAMARQMDEAGGGGPEAG